MNLGIDYHDTLTAHPEFFQGLAACWPCAVYIVTGTPESKRLAIEAELEAMGFEHYHGLLMGFEYDPAAMEPDHFRKMARHKLGLVKSHRIAVYYDDNPFYAGIMRNHGVATFQTCLSDAYLDEWEGKSPWYTANLQRGQFPDP